MVRGKATLSNVSTVYFILGILRTDLWSQGSQYDAEVLKQLKGDEKKNNKKKRIAKRTYVL